MKWICYYCGKSQPSNGYPANVTGKCSGSKKGIHSFQKAEVTKQVILWKCMYCQDRIPTQCIMEHQIKKRCSRNPKSDRHAYKKVTKAAPKR
jgi:hypothetical protein